MAAQDFRRSLQKSGEAVSDFICRLEKTYQVAYGKDDLNTATRDALLYGQLYEGLRYDIMLSPTVSGLQGYKELCTAAKGEERRLVALRQRQQYTKTPSTVPVPTSVVAFKPQETKQPRRDVTLASMMELKKCRKTGHFAMKCPQPKQESKGQPVAPTKTKQVHSGTRSCGQHVWTENLTPEELLLSSSDEESSARVTMVRIPDKGSVTQCVKVQVQGVPAYGMIDSGADISIIGGILFKKVATVARLKKHDFKKADKIPQTYDQQPFQLDGRMDHDIAFNEKTMTTPVYIKMDAHDQLLLSEGVCRQYHLSVECWRGGKRSTRSEFSKKNTASGKQLPDPSESAPGRPEEAKVPTVRVSLIQSVKLLPHQKIVEVTLACREEVNGPYLLEPAEPECGVQADQALLHVTDDREILAVVTNPTGQSMVLEEGSTLGEAAAVTLVSSTSSMEEPSDSARGDATMRRIQSKLTAWKKKLTESIGSLDMLAPAQQKELWGFLEKHHAAFALEEHERGETDLVQMTIETGDAEPRKCAPRRMTFAVR